MQFVSNDSINARPDQLQVDLPSRTLDVVFEVVNGPADKRAAKNKFENVFFPNGTQWGYIINYHDFTYLEWDPAVGAWYKSTWYDTKINAGGILPGLVVNLTLWPQTWRMRSPDILTMPANNKRECQKSYFAGKL